jgi:hypothetical protein
MPEQQIVEDDDGGFTIEFRPPVPAEEWNAQISLLTGMAAAELMVAAKVGILRILPTPPTEAIERFLREAKALGVEWTEGQPYGEFLRSLDRRDPRHLALIYDATGLFRGSAYAAFDGEVPANPEHGALASTYAHVTAPLRRLVDRFGLAVAEALSQGQPIPEWARSGLAALPEIMAASSRVASGVERACTDAVEAAVLGTQVGEVFDGVIVDNGQHGMWLLQLTDAAVVAQTSTRVRIDLGDQVRAATGGGVHRHRRGPIRGGRAGREPGTIDFRREESTRRSRSVANGDRPRNVRTPKGTVVANGHPGRPAGKCHREKTADRGITSWSVRVKGWCKRPPAAWVTRSAR